MKIPNLSFSIDLSRKTILIAIVIVGIVVTGVLIFTNLNYGFPLPNILGMSDNQIGKRAVDYINNNKLSNAPASLVGVSEASGLVKIKIKIGASEFDSYATKDGKLLFPQVFDMTRAEKNSTQNTSDQSSASGQGSGAENSGSKSPSCGV